MTAAHAAPAPGAGRVGTPGLGAVLFDMDGLLVDTEPLWFEAERAVMARMGGGWTREDQRALIGGTLERTVAYLRAKAPRPAEPETVGRWVVDTMAGLVRARGAPLLRGAERLLGEVAAAGLAHGLVTSAEREIMEAVLAVTGIDFPAAVCAQDVRSGKPSPEPYLRAAGLLGVAPARCVALEDSPNGAAAARAAGCAVVVVPSMPGLRYADGGDWVIAESLADVTLDHLRALAG